MRLGEWAAVAMLAHPPLRMHTFAIIGAGFSGSLVAVHLLRAARGLPLRVVLIDRSGAFGPGLAYGNGSESLLLNVVAGRMSALPEEPSDFIDWAKKKDPSLRGEMFLPRRMYGRYITDLLERSELECGAGSGLVRLTDAAIDVHASSDGRGIVVLCRDAGELHADTVVLAPGNAAPARPSWCDPAMDASGRYVADPWRGGALRNIARDERVLIVGTGLTMMDVALSLNEAGHRGTIDAVSRRGLMPQPHRHGNPGLAKLPDPLFSRTFKTVRELLHVIRAEAKRAESMGGDWRDAVNALRSITPLLWEALDERERRRFMDHLLPFWNTHRHRAPPSVAEAVEQLMGEKRLRVHAAKIRCARVVTGGVEVELQPRGSEWPGEKIVVQADRLINCTGPDADVRRSGDALIETLLHSGLVSPGPLGMGLDFDESGQVLRADGRAQPHVYLIGPARIGRLWETTAVPELRVQAAELARRIVEVARPVAVANGARIDVPGNARKGAEPSSRS